MSGPVYRVDVLICATAYIRANSAQEAAEIAESAFGGQQDASVSERTQFGEVPVSGRSYGDEGLPPLSLSPALTFYGRPPEGDGPAFLRANPYEPDDFECVHDSEES